MALHLALAYVWNQSATKKSKKRRHGRSRLRRQRADLAAVTVVISRCAGDGDSEGRGGGCTKTTSHGNQKEAPSSDVSNYRSAVMMMLLPHIAVTTTTVAQLAYAQRTEWSVRDNDDQLHLHHSTTSASSVPFVRVKSRDNWFGNKKKTQSISLSFQSHLRCKTGLIRMIMICGDDRGGGGSAANCWNSWFNVKLKKH